MVRAMVGASLVLSFLGSAWAGDQPKGVEPRVGLVKVDKDGRPYLSEYVIYTQQEAYKVKVLVNGREQERTEVRLVTVTKEVKFYLDEPAAEVRDSNGKAVDVKKLRLTGPTPVLVSADDGAVDPFYLRLVREGTLVVMRYRPAPRDLPPPKNDPPAKEKD